MAEENGNNTIATETAPPMQAESCIIINAAQVQSMDIGQQFTRVKTDNGWRIQLKAQARVTVNFITSMRKFETTLLQDDTIERDGDDIVLLRNQPADAYRTQRGTSSLARAPERPLISDPPIERTI